MAMRINSNAPAVMAWAMREGSVCDAWRTIGCSSGGGKAATGSAPKLGTGVVVCVGAGSGSAAAVLSSRLNRPLLVTERSSSAISGSAAVSSALKLKYLTKAVQAYRTGRSAPILALD